MAVQQFCLRWNNHQPNFISVFSSLLNSESLVDVTLAAEGRHLQAHKVVLSACSSYFQSLFMVNPCQHPIVILKDVKFIDLKTMVDFMYYGEVNVSQEQLPHILKTAEMLKIKGLAEMPDSTSLTKSQSSSTDKAELLTPGDSNWSSDAPRHSSSPSPCPLSPASRRKRLRKSSTGSGSASTERTSEDHPGEVTLTSPAGSVTGVTKTEPNTSFSSDGGASHSTIKQHSSDSDTIRNSSQESIEEDHHRHQQTQPGPTPRSHVTLQMQQQSDVQSVVQTMDNPMMEIPDPSTSGGCTQPVPGVQWTLVEHTYPRFAMSACQTALSTEGSNHAQTMHYMPSSGALPSCAMAGEGFQSPQGPAAAPASPCPSVCPSPCSSPSIAPTPQAPVRRKRSINPQADENFVRALEAVRFGGIGFCKAARMYGVNNRTLWLEYKKRGYPNTRPSIKARVKQECQRTPSPKSSPGPPPVDVNVNDQHSHQQQSQPQQQQPQQQQAHPVHHPQQQQPVMCSPPPHPMSGVLDRPIGTKRGRLLMRQPRIKKDSDPCQQSPEADVSSPHYLTVPPIKIERQCSEPSPNLLSVPTSNPSLVKQHSHPLLPSQIHQPSVGHNLSTPPSAFHSIQFTSTPFSDAERAISPMVIVSDPLCSEGAVPTPTLRVRTDELRRAASSPQTSSPRSSHCPAVRPGPALGCNFCWNTIDGHGRILRRKTKYHCPECQTNLCIVPCFQDYHERQANGADPSQLTSAIQRVFPKTSSI